MIVDSDDDGLGDKTYIAIIEFVIQGRYITLNADCQISYHSADGLKSISRFAESMGMVVL